MNTNSIEVFQSELQEDVDNLFVSNITGRANDSQNEALDSILIELMKVQDSIELLELHHKTIITQNEELIEDILSEFQRLKNRTSRSKLLYYIRKFINKFKK